MGYLVFAIGIILMAVLLASSGCRKIANMLPQVHAMCYVVEPVQTKDYVCPKCGARTFYPIGMDYFVTDGPKELITTQLKGLGITGIEFDREQFCKSCNPDIKDPKVVAIVNYEDGRKAHRVEGVTSHDYRLLALMRIHGKRIYSEDKSEEVSLKRLSELLGIELESQEKEEKVSE